MIYLYEDIEAVKRQPEFSGIDDDTFMILIGLDPTYKKGSDSLGTYSKWILNHFKKGDIKYTDFEDVTLALTLFNKYRKVLPNKDIGKYRTVDDIMNAVANMNDDTFYDMMTPSQKVRYKKRIKSGKTETAAKDNYSVEFRDDEWTVFMPHTHEASMNLGSGTAWCTAHENPEWYDSYVDGGEDELYIFINNKDGTKYQYSTQNAEFRDARDEEADKDELMSGASEKFKQFLRGLDPKVFWEPELINGLLVHNGYIVGYDEDELSVIYGDGSDTLVIPDGIYGIDNQGLSGLRGFYEIYIPKSVVSIGSSAFYMSDIVEIYIPDSVRFIGRDAFYGCTKLQKVRLPNKLDSIFECTFSDCKQLSSIVIPENVRQIHVCAFRRCTNLESAVFLNPYTMGISDSAFLNCDNLTIYSDVKYDIVDKDGFITPVKPLRDYKGRIDR